MASPTSRASVAADEDPPAVSNLYGIQPLRTPQHDLRAARFLCRHGRLLGDWCPPFSRYHLCHPSRRQPTPAFTLLVDALRYSRASNA